MPPDKKESDRGALAKYYQYSHAGLQFFLAVGMFTGGGIWLDRRLGTEVLFTLVGFALGFAGGLYTLCREFLFRKKPGEKLGSTAGEDAGQVPRDPNQKHS